MFRHTDTYSVPRPLRPLKFSKISLPGPSLESDDLRGFLLRNVEGWHDIVPTEQIFELKNKNLIRVID